MIEFSIIGLFWILVLAGEAGAMLMLFLVRKDLK